MHTEFSVTVYNVHGRAIGDVRVRDDQPSGDAGPPIHCAFWPNSNGGEAALVRARFALAAGAAPAPEPTLHARIRASLNRMRHADADDQLAFGPVCEQLKF